MALSSVGMTPTQLKAARHSLGLSAEAFARLVRVGNGRTVRRWEAGEREIPGPVEVIVELLVNGVLRVDFGEPD
jgi:DNA-binding transcriptional regulator YiaG